MLALWACGGEEPTGPSTVASVIVTPSAATLVSLDESVQLNGSAVDAGGNQIPGKTFTWSSSDAGVAAVSLIGEVTAVANGSVTITATAGDPDGTAAVVVDQLAAQFAFTTQPNNAVVAFPVTPAVEVAVQARSETRSPLLRMSSIYR